MGIEILEDKETAVSHYPMWKVVMENDPVTPMDFVVLVLMNIFGFDITKAAELMLIVHHQGRAMIGIYTLEVAELKVDQVHSTARTANYPLTCSLEKA